MFVMEMSAERRDNGLGLGGVITAHGGEDGSDGMIRRKIRNVLNSGRDTIFYCFYPFLKVEGNEGGLYTYRSHTTI
jgi:hypothetical protein